MKTNNIFERNPKTTLSVVIGVFTFGAVFFAENILELKRKYETLYYPNVIAQRGVKLREAVKLDTKIKRTTWYPKELLKASNLEDIDIIIQTDSNGFILPKKLYTNPDLTTVFLGGSTTECIVVEPEYRFPSLFAELTEKESSIKINSFNASMGGNHTWHSLSNLFYKVLAIQPDMAVMMHAGNDLNTMLYEGNYWNNKNPDKQMLNWLSCQRIPKIKPRFRNYFTNHFIAETFLPTNLIQRVFPNFDKDQIEYDEWADSRQTQITFDSLKIIKEYERALQLFVSTCQIYDIQPILMTQMHRLDYVRQNKNTPLETERYINIYLIFNEKIREVAKRNAIPLIDLAKQIPPEPKYIYDFVHLTPDGSKLAAKIITETLQESVKNLHQRKQK